MRRLPTLLILLVVITLLGVSLVRQRQVRAVLLAEREGLQSDRQLRQRLQAEYRRLEEAQSPPQEIEHLRRESTELTKAREALAMLRQALSKPDGMPDSPPHPGDRAPKPPQPPLDGPRHLAEDWKFAGTANPQATFESVVWTATHGDVEQLAPLLTFEPESRKRIEALFSELSPEARTQYGSPEKMAATLLSVQIPSSLQAFGEVASLSDNKGDTTVRIRLENTQAADKDANFLFRPSTSGWRLVVPTDIVNHLSLTVAPAPRPAG